MFSQKARYGTVIEYHFAVFTLYHHIHGEKRVTKNYYPRSVTTGLGESFLHLPSLCIERLL